MVYGVLGFGPDSLLLSRRLGWQAPLKSLSVMFGAVPKPGCEDALSDVGDE